MKEPRAQLAGVQKAPRHEVAGSWAPARQRALWRFNAGADVDDGRDAGTTNALAIILKRVTATPMAAGVTMHSVDNRAQRGGQVSAHNKADSVAAEESGIVVPLRKWKRRFDAGIPDEALTWKNSKQRSRRMFAWRCAVMTKFDSSARVLRTAWLLDSLCQKEGYAFATDDYISKTLGTPLNKVQQALTELERAGAVVAAQFRKAYPMPGAYLEIGLLVRRRIQPAAEASREVPLF
jgi:hypothetical protein